MVDAILGRSVAMPCDIEPLDRDDRVHMVLWFREKGGKPLYSFDVRGRSFAKALYWSDDNVFGPRAYFQTVSKPAALALDSVALEDEGVYRCRVDFKNSPTRNYQVNLTVIVPPHKITVYDKYGRYVNDSTGVIGPLNEGSDLLLKCEIRGGKPPPTVSWLVNDKLALGVVEVSKGDVILNRLEVPRVTREMFNSSFKCQASNSKLTLPLEKTARLELYLKPLTVKIVNKAKTLSAGVEYTIICESTGSRPQAEITWWRENRKFRKGKITSTSNETAVVGSLAFTPEPDDDGHILRCIADNPFILGSAIDDSYKFDVSYPPQVTLRLGNTLNPDDIKEGDDVYFECEIRANPREHKIIWFHNAQVVTHNVSSGVILSTKSLVLQGVTRHDSGRYSCMAVNVKGETVSELVALRVKFAPVCRSSEVVIVGASLGETLRIRCQVTADPTDVSFVWQFNNSGENFEVAPTRFGTANGSASELTYTPNIERDYGTLACWGKNAIGRQAEPCVFQIVPAARPGALRNCTRRMPGNATQEVLEVECLSGYDGGMTQHFILEAYESRTMRLRLNVSSTVPTFRVDFSDLLPTTAYTPMLHVVVYAVNAKGRSEAFLLEDIALKDAEKRTDSVTRADSGLAPLAVLGWLCAGAAAVAAVLFLLFLAVRRRKRPRNNYPGNESQSSKQKNSLLEINDNERKYVVSYTLKAPGDCVSDRFDRQPDILATPRGTTDVLTDIPTKRPCNIFTNGGIAKEYYSRDFTQAFNFVGYDAAEREKAASPKSDGTIRQTREGTYPRRSPEEPSEQAKWAPPTPTKGSANGNLKQFDRAIGSIPGPESCV
ncbi:UNVERIFIED_CONTAM: hypothetical protein PYX00_007628 [Menopon gallinae]|uniref:Ig-like domain-containing protein n=1 Tax=Menopon gallinae TaxID=328185 RepID=A0AAW2HJV9_9NEOP